MRKMAELYRESYRELRRVRTVTTAAMLMAVSVILGYFTIEAGPYLKIGFGSVVNQFVYYLFGPVTGAVYGGVLDLVRYVVKPTGGYFPGFTLNAILAGVIYGTVLYKHPLSLKRVIAANALVTGFVNPLLNTYWLTVLYGSAFGALLPARIMKEAVLLPIDILLYYTIARVLGRARVFHGLQGAAR